MKKIILVFCCLFAQLIISQTNNNNCFKCKYEFKEFYYIRINYVHDSGFVYMAGLTESDELQLTKEAHTFLNNFYNNGYYTPSILSFYRDVSEYCGDLFFNMLNDTKSYYTKELFFSKQISDKTIVKNIILIAGSNIQLNISKIKGVFFIIDKNNEDLDFTMSEELDIYEMNNIQKIYVPYDIVVEDISEIKLNINLNSDVALSH